MNVFVQIVAQYAPWIYAVCGLVALYNVYRIWQVRIERRQAVFSLERDKAKRDLYSVFFVVAALVFSMSGTYFVSSVLAAALEPEADASSVSTASVLTDFLAAPNTNSLPTPTFTPLPATDTPQPGPPTPEATPVSEEVVETPPPPPTNTPIVQAAICPAPQALITQPGNGQVVSGAVTVVGTATHEQFRYYKIEYAPGADAAGGYAHLADDTNPINGGVLGTFNSTNLANGVWTLQLTVVDVTGNYPPPCRVTITVQN